MTKPTTERKALSAAILGKAGMLRSNDAAADGQVRRKGFVMIQ